MNVMAGWVLLVVVQLCAHLCRPFGNNPSAHEKHDYGVKENKQRNKSNQWHFTNEQNNNDNDMA